MPVHPISFSIHPSKVVADVPPKTKLIAYIVPGEISTYIYDNEADYYQDYRDSFFAITTKKAGWDCLRHYEILANGCIPLFENIEFCPKNTMIHFPKEVIAETNQLFKDILSYSSCVEDLTQEHQEQCRHAIRILLEYTRERLTNPAMVQYMIRAMGVPFPRRILYLSQSPDCDYMKEMNLTGFKELLGVDCHEYPLTPYLYRPKEPVEPGSLARLYGRGMSYTHVLDWGVHDADATRDVASNLRRRIYDLVVYGSVHRGLPFWDLVHETYAKHEIVLVCGEDLHTCSYLTADPAYHVFIREL